MPLFIDNKKIDRTLSVDEFVTKFSEHFKPSCNHLLKQEVKTVGPRQLLYVGQREVAGTAADDSDISILGSEDATTCHIGVLRHTGSGATSMLHFDGSSTAQGLESMISIVSKLTQDLGSGRFEFHLVGGFLDPRQNSHEVSNELLALLHQCPQAIHLETACITDLNTTYKDSVPYPVIYGLACDVRSGEIFRATFPDKGPDMSLRNARHFGGNEENVDIYDPVSQVLTIGPFHYDQVQNINRLIQLPNHFIRKYLSTSPEQEPEGFDKSVRDSLIQIRDFPDPLNSVFKNGSKKYKKNPETGEWIKI